MSPQKITPCLWFDTQAEEASNLYVSVFKNSKIVRIERYPDAGQEIHGKPGSVMVVVFSRRPGAHDAERRLRVVLSKNCHIEKPSLGGSFPPASAHKSHCERYDQWDEAFHPVPRRIGK